MKKNCRVNVRSTWIQIGLLGATSFAAILATSRDVDAHCDTMDGPVVKSAKAALAKGNVGPVLRWIGAKDEPEIRSAFKRTVDVRGKSSEARILADHYFFETLVRLHRAGEGEPYTGLKPLGTPVEPIIRAGDLSLESGNVDKVSKAIAAELEEGIRQRFAEARERRKSANVSVAAGRKYVAAYVEYMHYLESVDAAIRGGAAHGMHGEEHEK